MNYIQKLLKLTTKYVAIYMINNYHNEQSCFSRPDVGHNVEEKIVTLFF